MVLSPYLAQPIRRKMEIKLHVTMVIRYTDMCLSLGHICI